MAELDFTNALTVYRPVANSLVPYDRRSGALVKFSTAGKSQASVNSSVSVVLFVFTMSLVSIKTGEYPLFYFSLGGAVLLLLRAVVKRLSETARNWWAETQGF